MKEIMSTILHALFVDSMMKQPTIPSDAILDSSVML